MPLRQSPALQPNPIQYRNRNIHYQLTSTTSLPLSMPPLSPETRHLQSAYKTLLHGIDASTLLTPIVCRRGQDSHLHDIAAHDLGYMSGYRMGISCIPSYFRSHASIIPPPRHIPTSPNMSSSTT